MADVSPEYYSKEDIERLGCKLVELVENLEHASTKTMVEVGNQLARMAGYTYEEEKESAVNYEKTKKRGLELVRRFAKAAHYYGHALGGGADRRAIDWYGKELDLTRTALDGWVSTPKLAVDYSERDGAECPNEHCLATIMLKDGQVDEEHSDECSHVYDWDGLDTVTFELAEADE